MGVYLLLSNDYIQILVTTYLPSQQLCRELSLQDRNSSAVLPEKDLAKYLVAWSGACLMFQEESQNF